MVHTPLPDLDYMTGASRAGLDASREDIDLSAHVLAAATADVWEMTPLAGKDGFGRAHGSLWIVEGWSFSEMNLPPALIELSDSHAQDSGTHILAERWVRGEERGMREDGEAVHVAPGVLDFFHQEVKLKTVATERCVQNVSIPRDLLGLPLDSSVELPQISNTSSIGQLVFAEWDDLYEDLKRGVAALPKVKLDRTVACVKIALGVNPQREDVRNHARNAIFREICRFIEQNLENPNLSTHLLLDQFGVSRATLYRMFEPLGGVRNYVTERRAASALFFISNHEGRRGFVHAACERFGFSSPANFNRTIQRLFGNSPRALLHGPNGARRERQTLSEFVHDYLGVAYNGAPSGLPDLAA